MKIYLNIIPIIYIIHHSTEPKLEYLFTSNFNLISLNKIYNSLDNYIGNLQQRYQLINVVKYDSSNEKIRQYIIDKIVNIEQHISTYISILHSKRYRYYY